MKKTNENQNQVLNQEEPENYIALRDDIKYLMIDMKKVKDRLKTICAQPVIAEQFSERSSVMSGEISQMIWTLGEMYGFSLADDITEGAISNEYIIE